MKKIFILTLLLTTGCSTTVISHSNSTCEYPVERNLTASYHERYYWCAPEGYHNAPKQKQSEPKEEGLTAIHTTEQATTTNFIVPFFSHDHQYDIAALSPILSLNRPLKIRGCRLESESPNLNFGRALRIRNDLRSQGYSEKITILNDVSCLGSKAAEVR